MITMVEIPASREAWKYFMDKVSDDAAATKGVTSSYYLKGGNPPGRWYGTGLAGLGLSAGAAVRGAQLENLFGHGTHPLTGDQLGRAFTVQTPLQDRIDARLAQELADATTDVDEDAVISKVVEEEAARRVKPSVSGFEVVFNPPKSVSVWWALADAGMKEQILAAHHAAVTSTMAALERDAARTRTGTNGVAQNTVRGVSAAGFDHWETRDGDPQLHTHMLIANRVQGEDGVWRTLDSRHALYPSVVTLSEKYDADLMDQLSLRFGIRWTEQSVMRNPKSYRRFRTAHGLPDTQASRARYATEVADVAPKNQKWEIEGVPLGLNELFSTRAKQVRAGKDALIREYVDRYGHHPSRYTVLKMRAAVAIRSRRRKQHHTLRSLTKSWRARAEPLVGNTFRFAERIGRAGAARLPELRRWSFRADDVLQERVDELATVVLQELGQTKATWRRSNAAAEAQRLTKMWTFRGPADRDDVVARVVDRVIEQAHPLTPETHLHVPYRFQTPDGASQFAPTSRDLFTTHEVFAAEERLLQAAREQLEHLVIDPDVCTELLHTPTLSKGYRLSDDQAAAVARVVASGRLVDVLVGPAGAGKTTTLEKFRELWEVQNGPGSARGLAPTAAAAEILAKSLGIDTENTAKWIFETTTKDTHTTDFHLKAGQVVIVDEASIGGTMALDELRAQAKAAGAKLLLVGDWAQLSAIDAGGAFGMLVGDMDDAPELVEIRRFASDWEAAASTLVRLGKTAGLTPYLEHGRVHWGHEDALIHQVVDAWKADEASGKVSLLIAPTNQVTDRLNQIARMLRLEAGLITGAEAAISRDARAAAGDRIVSRQNNRLLRTSAGNWVKNNHEWVVTKVALDGSVTAARIGVDEEETVTFPASYVSEHLELAYATTTHRAQGRTVDTAHAIVDASVTRSNFYVALTRAEQCNTVYVQVDPSETMEGWNDGMEHSYLDILDGILSNRGTELSAHDTAADELTRVTSIQQLAAEYDTIAQAVATPRYARLLEQHGIANPEDSPSFGALVAAMRHADENGQDITAALPALIARRGFGDAEDPVAVMHYRCTRWSATAPMVERPLIAGLIPRAIATDDADLQRALDERADAIQLRAELALDAELQKGAGWTRTMGSPPLGREEIWRQAACVIAAYRDKYGIDDPQPLGNAEGLQRVVKRDRDRAERALNVLTGQTSAAAVAPATTTTTVNPSPSPGQVIGLPGIDG